MEGDKCEVYSSSQKTWHKGEITKQLPKEGWITVAYGDGLEKDLHIDDKEHLKLFSAKPKTQRSNIGRKSKVFSQSQQKWMDGVVTKELDGGKAVTVAYGDGLEKDLPIGDRDLKLSASKSPTKNQSQPTNYAMKPTNSKPGPKRRKSNVGRKSLVYSQSQQKWMDGVVTKDLDGGKAVTVAYGEGLEKDLPIGDQDLKLSALKSAKSPTQNQMKSQPINPTNNPINTAVPTPGSRCKIFSKSQNKWITGTIVKSLPSDHVRVQYHGLEKDLLITSPDFQYPVLVDRINRDINFDKANCRPCTTDSRQPDVCVVDRSKLNAELALQQKEVLTAHCTSNQQVYQFLSQVQEIQASQQYNPCENNPGGTTIFPDGLQTVNGKELMEMARSVNDMIVHQQHAGTESQEFPVFAKEATHNGDSNGENTDGALWNKLKWLFIGLCICLLIGIIAFIIFSAFGGENETTADTTKEETAPRRLQFDDDAVFYLNFMESSSTTFPLIQAIVSVVIIAIAISIQSIFMYLR